MSLFSGLFVPSDRIALWESEDSAVSTVAPSDAPGYETAIRHPEYNEGDWIIVAVGDTTQEIMPLHDEWVMRMAKDDLPDEITDVGRSPLNLQETHVRTPLDTTEDSP